VREKIRELRAAAPSGGVIDRTTAAVKDLKEELEQATAPEPTTVGRAAESGEIDVKRAVPVEVQDTKTSPLETLLGFLGPVVGPVGTGGLVVVLTIFILLQREDLRDRAIRLFGSGDLTRATQAMDDAARRVSRYLLMQLIINVAYGVPVAIGLWLIGVPNALLWGLLAAILRFIPYIGPLIGAFFPLVLAIAAGPGWTMFLLTLLLIVGLELFTNNVLEPWLYGSSTGLSPVAILVAALFWTSLWGPVGLLLATPLTVCLVVLGRHVPQLQFLDIVLGSEPAMLPHARIYQRLLAGDTREATEIAEDFVDAEGMESLGDDVLLPVLQHAEEDRRRGALDGARQVAVARGVEEIAEFLLEPEGSDAELQGQRTILCLGEGTPLDAAAAAIIGQLVERELAVSALTLTATASRQELRHLRERDVVLVCLTRLGSTSAHRVERITRRLSATIGADVPVVHAVLANGGSAGEAVPMPLTNSIAATLAEIRQRLEGALPKPADAAA
jgi:predicted PurR-regulated permease PerM